MFIQEYIVCMNKFNLKMKVQFESFDLVVNYIMELTLSSAD